MGTKYDRQIELLNYLSSGKLFIYRELANKFRVSVKTIKKDVSELSLFFPIYTYVGRNGGVCINKNYVTNGLILKKRYMELLVEGLTLLKSQKNNEDIDILISYFETN